MGFWKTSKPHGDEKSKPIGRHVDVYHTDDDPDSYEKKKHQKNRVRICMG